jgi:hypothetical protein
MILALILAASAPETALQKDKHGYSQSYGVWVSMNGRICNYWLTDTGMNSKQLTDALKGGYEVRRGVEILTGADTPIRCVREARHAIKRAGIIRIRARPGTDKDRLQGIP